MDNAVLGAVQKDVKQGRVMIAAVVAVSGFMLFAIMALQLFAIQATMQIQTDANDDALHIAGTDRVVRTRNYDFDVSDSGLAMTRAGVPLSTAKAPTHELELSSDLPDERLDNLEFLKLTIDGDEMSLKILGWARIKEESFGQKTSAVVFMTPMGNLRLVGDELIYPKTVAAVVEELDDEDEDEVHGERKLLQTPWSGWSYMPNKEPFEEYCSEVALGRKRCKTIVECKHKEKRNGTIKTKCRDCKVTARDGEIDDSTIAGKKQCRSLRGVGYVVNWYSNPYDSRK